MTLNTVSLQINWGNFSAFEQAHERLNQMAIGLFKRSLIDQTIKAYQLHRVFGDSPKEVYTTVDKFYEGFKEVYQSLDIPVPTQKLTERCTFMAMQLQRVSEPSFSIEDILRNLSISSMLWMERRDSRNNTGFEHSLINKSSSLLKKHDEQMVNAPHMKDFVSMKELIGVNSLPNKDNFDVSTFEQAHEKLDQVAIGLFNQQREYQNQPSSIIDRTIETYSLSSDASHTKIHRDVDKLYKGFEEVYQSLGLEVNSKELIERCTFMAIQLQEASQSHVIQDLGEQDLARRVSVSSLLWMQGRDKHHSLSYEDDLLYKSAEIVNTHNKRQEQDPKTKDSNSIQELTNVRDSSKIDLRHHESYEKAQQKLEKVAQKILEQQKIEQQRIIQRQQEQQRLLQHSRGLER